MKMSAARDFAAGGAPRLGEGLQPSSDLREGAQNENPSLGDGSDSESCDSHSEFDEDGHPFEIGSVSPSRRRKPVFTENLITLSSTKAKACQELQHHLKP